MLFHSFFMTPLSWYREPGKSGRPFWSRGEVGCRRREVEAEFDAVTRRLEQLRAELAALNHQAIDEKDLKAALASFEPVWQELSPAERARILHLLIEEVRYDAEAGEVAITFRPGGVRSLAREDGTEPA